MSAATENTTRRVVSVGNVMEEVTDVTWDNNVTFTSEFASIFGWTFTPTTNASFGITQSGTVLTLVSGGSLRGILTVRSDGT